MVDPFFVGAAVVPIISCSKNMCVSYGVSFPGGRRAKKNMILRLFSLQPGPALIPHQGPLNWLFAKMFNRIFRNAQFLKQARVSNSFFIERGKCSLFACCMVQFACSYLCPFLNFYLKFSAHSYLYRIFLSPVLLILFDYLVIDE